MYLKGSDSATGTRTAAEMRIVQTLTGVPKNHSREEQNFFMNRIVSSGSWSPFDIIFYFLYKDIVHERAWVKTSTFAVGVRILAETRNRRHSRELFKLLRENYDDVQVLGFYDSPEDYVAGNLLSEAFEHVEEETPFEGDMNKQYNPDMIEEEYSEDDDNTASSVEVQEIVKAQDQLEKMNVSSSISSNMDKVARRSSRNFY